LLQDGCQNRERCDLYPGELTKLRGNVGLIKDRLNRKELRKCLTGRGDPLDKDLKSLALSTNQLEEEVTYLELRVKTLELQKKLLLLSLEHRWSWVLRQGLLYVSLVVIFWGFSCLVYNKVLKNPQSEISISVDYDVGTILGGVLVGGAAIIAATTYANSGSSSSGGGGSSGRGEGPQ
jgi:hypothetical protein